MTPVLDLLAHAASLNCGKEACAECYDTNDCFVSTCCEFFNADAKTRKNLGWSRLVGGTPDSLFFAKQKATRIFKI